VRSGPVLQIDALKILIYNIPWCPRTMAEQAKYAMRIKLTPKGWVSRRGWFPVGYALFLVVAAQWRFN
jgi:hypothetical protein